MLNDIFEEVCDQMEKTIEFLRSDLGSIRTGRASRGLVDKIRVDYFGASTPLQQLASISIPEPRSLMLNPYDKTAVPLIEKAIMASELGITPSSDGKVIRLNFPPLTEDRRKQLVKMIKKKGEDSKVALRNIRRDYNESVKELKKEGDIPEDEMNRGLKKIQDYTDEYSARVDETITAKEKEIMSE
ncbi:MAG: ribosome recycling factor [Candidatus Wallbacteria bacterium HGW-Wallbacteria-1]|uniref:Ribosome-recycling factor n=1 Tax=Candidatus Wallbacteria bacterium HGW-Wallbacteria-1 TaxID=2013854 RepID=A0A2N1PQB2_9BACT|nr:MAG: ribosome recycling factor [Candidatus Wallbacteria bacterium HGW-Wallbacteria-1]